MELEYYKVQKVEKTWGYSCHFNEGCICHKKECYKCGWNPKVAESRLQKILKGEGNG